MKYQSELIKEIVDKRGHKFPSLHYQSECIEEWIKEVEGSYPKLCDYEGEWLNYIVESPIGEFPYVTLTDVTEATINNVVPYAYKSAILKGQTLVNLFKNKVTHRDTGKLIYVEEGDKIQATFKDGVTNGWIGFSFKENVPFEIGKTYTVMNELYKCDDQLISFNISLGNKSFTNTKPVIGINKLKIIIPSDYTEGANWMYYNVNNTNNSATIFSSNLLILEGDYTQEDIPYFEGMQSVKMPVLTTTGKNLFDGISFKKWWVNVDEGVQKTETGNNKSILINIKPNTKYRLSGEGINRGAYAFLSANFEELSRGGNTTGTRQTEESPSGSKYLLWYLHNEDISNCSNVQVEEGAVATSYEPYKSNILTVNEDVTLRSNGSVYDELDLLTGKLTQRIDEDGSVLTQEVVKTVDLNIQDQYGNTLSKIKPIEGTMHLSTDGETIRPTFTGEIPVEAITQNLASFIEE